MDSFDLTKITVLDFVLDSFDLTKITVLDFVLDSFDLTKLLFRICFDSLRLIE